MKRSDPQSQHELLATIIDDLPVAIFMKDKHNDFKFKLWNKSAEQLWGLKQKDVIDKNDYDFFPKAEADFFRTKDLEVLKSGKPLLIEEESITLPNGEVHFLRTKKVPINGRYLLGVSEDITKLKLSQQEAEAQKVALIATAKMSSLGEMASGIAHEINNPLAIIVGKAAQMKEKLESKQLTLDTFKIDLAKIEKTADRITKIVRGLRNFSRQADNDPLESALLTQIIDDTLELCGERLRHLCVDLRIKVDPKLSLKCKPSQISQILLNLICNSYDAIEKLPEKWIQIDASASKTSLKISVTDSGKGIKPHIAEKMMQPFFTTKDVGKGTGLGLSISKGLIEGHRGSLRYDPQSPNTRFILEMPLR